jgi:ubiquinone/menaquinone biosynthesis C-methylase UbiE
MPCVRIVFALMAALLITRAPLAAQDAPARETAKAKPGTKSAKGAGKSSRKARRDPPGTYMGRTIAPVMSFQHADWLIRDTRAQEEEPEKMVEALKIEPGSTVADVGAGVGYTSRLLARQVGPEGTVFATDVQPEMLRMLAENMRQAGIKNVKPVRATPTDTKLPEGKVDLVLMVDVYHECSDPEAVLKGIHKALKPGGRLVLVEFRAEDPEVPIIPEHKMTLAQVRRELEPQGFQFKDSLEFLPWQHIIFFEKPGDEKKPANGETKSSKDSAPKQKSANES